MFSKKFDRRVYITLAVLLFSLALGVSFATYALWPANVEQGYRPAQPIDFSHALMAGEFEIPCIFCHSNAEKGAHAGIPPTSTCMKCHQEIRPKDSRGELKVSMVKLLDHWEKKTPILWERVHDLADFVYFDHSRHMAPASDLECADCHGEVEKMERLRRENSLKMGWCLECHREPPPEGSPPDRTTRAPITCTTCHR